MAIVVGSSLRSRIAALVQAEPAQADDLAVRGASIEIVEHADLDVGELRLPAEIVRSRLRAGVPLLDRLDVPIPSSAVGLLERLAVATLADPAASTDAEVMLAALRDHRLHAEQLVGEALVGHQDHLSALAASAGLPPQLIQSVADLAASAVLGAMAGRLRPALSLAHWDRDYCPVCGGRPVFAEAAPAEPALSRGEEGLGSGAVLGRLRCGRCATSWAYSLQRCPDCHGGRLTPLDTSHVAEVGGWTLLICDTCRGYLKVAPSSRSERLADLLVDDLATWRLDRVALEGGRERHAETGYRLEHGELPGEELDDD